LGHLLKVLRESRRIPVHTVPPQTSADIVLQGFHQYLRHVQGMTESTCSQYTRHVRNFLIAKFGVDPINLSRLAPGEVIRFVEESGIYWRPKTTKLLCSSLRCFLRFVQLNGLSDGRLASAVPTIPERKLSHVPKTLTDAQLQSLLSSFDRQRPIGRRDFAIALCLCRLALRSCEVAQLRLDDIDWRSGTIHIKGKSRRTSVLPLPPRCGSSNC
jgi:site-specific recombinase XerC